MKLTTKRGYDFGEVASALQKAIRRGDAQIAGYFAMELHESNYHQYAWKRLLCISAEDCAGIITQEIIALHDAFLRFNKGNEEIKGRVFLAKAVLLLCQAKKSRDADHLVCLVPKLTAAEKFDSAIQEARREPENLPVPDYAFDVHTRKGRAMGKTKTQFFRDEFLNLHPREQGQFDWTCEPQNLAQLDTQQ